MRSGRYSRISERRLVNEKCLEFDCCYLFNIILKAVPIAMGVAVVVTSLLGELDMTSGFTMLGVGLACIGIYLLKHKN